MTPDLGIERGPHWWEASALSTTPSLQSNNEETNVKHLQIRDEPYLSSDSFNLIAMQVMYSLFSVSSGWHVYS